MAYADDINYADLDPVLPAAWCSSCTGLRNYALPLLPIERYVIPLTVTGQPVGEMAITVRRGRCRDCGDDLYRVGGGRAGEA